MFTARFELQSRPRRKVDDRAGDEDLERAREVGDATRDVDCDARDVGGPELDLAGVQAGAERDTDFLRGGNGMGTDTSGSS